MRANRLIALLSGIIAIAVVPAPYTLSEARQKGGYNVSGKYSTR